MTTLVSVMAWLSDLLKDPATVILIIALFSGMFQAAGYVVYLQKSAQHELEPNPTTWIMFAYGTAVLTALEYDHDASFLMLILPLTCAFYSLRVAANCWREGKLKWPTHWLDRAAFLMDISLTLGYITTAVLSRLSFISEDLREEFVLAFLVLSNTSTIVSFIPILRETAEKPRNEHPLPWLIWTIAYSCLAYVTYVEEGKTVWTVFMLYPLSGITLHGLVGLLSLRRFTAPA